MDIEKVEQNNLIAQRVPPGDRWFLVDDPKETLHNTLTDALEAYLLKTGFKGAYRLDPMDSKLYAIETNEVEVVKEEPKQYGIYGEISWKQGV